MKYLGIDFGGKRIGLAVSDEGGQLAFPHSVIKNNLVVAEKISSVVSKEGIAKIVIGESKNFKGEDNEIMAEIKKLKNKLEKDFGLQVALEPEFLTSVQAKSIQGENELHDASAAAIILQSHLDKLN